MGDPSTLNQNMKVNPLIKCKINGWSFYIELKYESEPPYKM